MVRFAEPEIGVSPGQACVVYDAATGSRVLGGGFIRRSAMILSSPRHAPSG